MLFKCARGQGSPSIFVLLRYNMEREYSIYKRMD